MKTIDLQNIHSEIDLKIYVQCIWYQFEEEVS